MNRQAGRRPYDARITAQQERYLRGATVTSVNAAIRKYSNLERVTSVFAGDLRSPDSGERR